MNWITTGHEPRTRFRILSLHLGRRIESLLVFKMIACIDVYYSNDEAYAAAIVLEHWDDSDVVEEYSLKLLGVGDYQPGKFYERELKPVVEIVKLIEHPIKCYVIDAYCHLSDHGEPGLGAHLFPLVPAGATVIGVAKNRFRDSRHAVEVCRGGSNRPLYVTAIGMEYAAAAKLIVSMAGKHRMPAMLKYVDSLSRKCKASSNGK